MLIDSYPVEDVFARVPEVATQTDPVPTTLDTLHRQLQSKGEEKEMEQKRLYQKLVETAEQMVQQTRKVVSVLKKETRDSGEASGAASRTGAVARRACDHANVLTGTGG